MQNADWAAIFRQFPADMHAQLVLVLNNRMEVSIETIFRIEPTYLMVRGRMGGTTDGGILYMVPYSQMTAVYLFRQIIEEEVAAIFGSPSSSNKTLQRSANGTERPVAPGPSQSTPIPGFGKAPEATAVARNNLLERLRAARQAATPPPAPKS
jgi:hypothetical protein